MNDTKIISILNRKGGAGKTSTAQNLAFGLLRKGYHVLLIDLDSQCNLTKVLSGSGNYDRTQWFPTIYEVLKQTNTINEALMPLFEDTKEEIEQRIKEGKEATQWDFSSYYVKGSKFSSNLDMELHGVYGSEFRLKEAIETYTRSNSVDYVIIDTPAQLQLVSTMALIASTHVIIPVQADMFSQDGVNTLCNDAIIPVRHYTNHNLKIAGILLTRFSGRATLSQNMKSSFSAMASALDTILFDTTIRECTAIKEAQLCRQSIYKYAPRSNGAIDYKNFTEELLKVI